MSRIARGTVAASVSAFVIASLAVPASAHVGVTWSSPQAPQLGKTSLIKLVVPHGCSFTNASLTTPDGSGTTTLQKLGVPAGYTPANGENAAGTWKFSTTSMEVAIPRVDPASSDVWLGVNSGAVAAQFMPGTGWNSSVDESNAAATVANFTATTDAAALPYHQFMEFGIRIKIETKKSGTSYLAPTTSATGGAVNQLMLLTKQGCKVVFSNGTDTVTKTVYGGDLVNGWGSSSPALTVGLDPAADLTKGPKGDPGANGKDGKDGANGKDGKDGKDGANGKDGAKGDKGDAGASGGSASASRWAGDFEVSRAGSKVVIDIDSSTKDAGRTFAISDAKGRAVASGKLDKRGDATVTLSGSKARALPKGSALSLKIGSAAKLASANS